MTVTVNFKINAISKQLEVSLLKNEATEQENCIAKRILSMSTQLSFVNLPVCHGIDVGASIEVSAEEGHDGYDDDDDDDEFYEYDIDNQYVADADEDESNVEERVNTIDEVIDLVKEEEVRHIERLQNQVDCDKTQAEIDEMVHNGQPLRWAEGEDYIDVRLNLSEANKIIGGLTTPSSIATMMIYELFKKTIHKVEKYV